MKIILSPPVQTIQLSKTLLYHAPHIHTPPLLTHPVLILKNFTCLSVFQRFLHIFHLHPRAFISTANCYSCILRGSILFKNFM